MTGEKKFWLVKQFQLGFHKKRGMEFQDFFSDIMGTSYPGRFVKVRPYGPRGDRKCDGYMLEDDTLYQVYAPYEIKEDELNSKIEEDFEGAKDRWPDMKKWIFVHNDARGLPAGTTDLIRRLRSDNPDVEVEVWGECELRHEVLGLEVEQLESLFGPGPDVDDMRSLGFGDLRPVLDFVSRGEPPVEQDIKPVSPEKIDANGLSDVSQALLRIGRLRDKSVEEYLSTKAEPEYGEGIAEAFRGKYRELRGKGLEPEYIFDGLLEFAGGSYFRGKQEQAGVLAVITHLFERCDIFENPAQDKEDDTTD